MLGFLARRIRYSLLVLWGVVSLVFFLFNVLPADPARLVMGNRTDQASINNVRHDLNLDRPIFTRYLLYIDDLLPLAIHNRSAEEANKYHYLTLFPVSSHKCLVLKWPYLGRSYRSRREVSAILAEALPGTIVLAVAAMTLATIRHTIRYPRSP